jgi:hypothetical protein
MNGDVATALLRERGFTIPVVVRAACARCPRALRSRGRAVSAAAQAMTANATLTDVARYAAPC